MSDLSRKILIFGNSGSGKSTLANRICESEDLAHLDLDTLAWEATIPPVRKSMAISALLIEQFISGSDGWVIEGCYTDLLEIALPFANEMIFMNLPVKDCIRNARSRPWEPHKYDSKQAQDDNLGMLIDWISQYDQRNDTFSAESHRSLYTHFRGKKTMHLCNEKG